MRYIHHPEHGFKKIQETDLTIYLEQGWYRQPADFPKKEITELNIEIHQANTKVLGLKRGRPPKVSV